MWGLPEEFIARAPTLAEMINYNRDTGLYDVPGDQWDAYVAATCGSGPPRRVPATQFRRRDGRILRYQALVLPGGGRMLTYFDITDLVRRTSIWPPSTRPRSALMGRLEVTELLETLITRAGQLLNAPHGVHRSVGTGRKRTGMQDRCRCPEPDGRLPQKPARAWRE